MHGESSRARISGFFEAIDARVLNCEQKGKVRWDKRREVVVV